MLDDPCSSSCIAQEHRASPSLNLGCTLFYFKFEHMVVHVVGGALSKNKGLHHLFMGDALLLRFKY